MSNLMIDIGASVARLEKDMSRARGTMDRFSRNAASSLKSLQSAFYAIGSVAAIGGIGRFIKQNIEAADAIAKMADEVGLSTSALQEYRYAASLAGVAQTAFDKSMERFSRRVGEAVKGQGELNKVLLEYGIATQDVQGHTRTVEAIFNDIADAIKGADNAQEKLRITFNAFGREGGALVNLLNDGSRAMDEMRQEARDLGGVLGEDLVRNAEDANDALTRVTTSLSTQWKKTTLGLSPLITRFLESLTRDLQDINKLFGFEGTGEGEGKKELETRLENLNRLLEYHEKTTKKINALGGERAIRKTRMEIIQLELLLEDLNKKGEGEPIKRDKILSLPTPKEMKTIADEYKKTYDILDEKTSKQGALNQKIWQMEQDAAEDRKRANADLAQSEKEAWEQRNAELGKQNLANLRIFNMAQDDVKEKNNEMFSDMKVAMAGWASDWSGNLTDMVFGAETTFKDIFRSFAKMITQMAIQRALTRGLSFIGFEHGGVIEKFAAGGVLNRPTIFPMAKGLGLAGEAGPEGVLPLARTSTGDLGVKATDMPGEQAEPINFTANIYAMDSQSLSETMRKNPQAIIGPFIEAFKRGGFLRDTLREGVR